jgi:hypothetical protein
MSKTFTIITGPGRCGTSALTKFFINSSKFKIDGNPNEIPSMRAGHESSLAIEANCYLSTQPNTFGFQPNQPQKGVDILKKIENQFDLVKTPTFFYQNTYHIWKLFSRRPIQVILLKRTPLESVLKSSEIIGKRNSDWGMVKDVNHLQSMLDNSINNLERHSIPYTILDFPYFISNPQYLHNGLISLDFDFTLKEIELLSKQTFDLNKVNIK